MKHSIKILLSSALFSLTLACGSGEDTPAPEEDIDALLADGESQRAAGKGDESAPNFIHVRPKSLPSRWIVSPTLPELSAPVRTLLASSLGEDLIAPPEEMISDFVRCNGANCWLTLFKDPGLTKESEELIFSSTAGKEGAASFLLQSMQTALEEGSIEGIEQEGNLYSLGALTCEAADDTSATCVLSAAPVEVDYFRIITAKGLPPHWVVNVDLGVCASLYPILALAAGEDPQSPPETLTFEDAHIGYGADFCSMTLFDEPVLSETRDALTFETTAGEEGAASFLLQHMQAGLEESTLDGVYNDGDVYSFEMLTCATLTSGNASCTLWANEAAAGD